MDKNTGEKELLPNEELANDDSGKTRIKVQNHEQYGKIQAYQEAQGRDGEGIVFLLGMFEKHPYAYILCDLDDTYSLRHSITAVDKWIEEVETNPKIMRVRRELFNLFISAAGMYAGAASGAFSAPMIGPMFEQALMVFGSQNVDDQLEDREEVQISPNIQGSA